MCRRLKAHFMPEVCSVLLIHKVFLELYIDYLRSSDHTSPFEKTCRAMKKAYQKGKSENLVFQASPLQRWKRLFLSVRRMIG